MLLYNRQNKSPASSIVAVVSLKEHPREIVVVTIERYMTFQDIPTSGTTGKRLLHPATWQ